MRGAHLTNPHLRWSYYFSGSGDFLVVYPFASGRDFMQGAAVGDLRRLPRRHVRLRRLPHGHARPRTRTDAASGRRSISTPAGRAGWSAMPHRSTSATASWAWSGPTSCSTSSSAALGPAASGARAGLDRRRTRRHARRQRGGDPSGRRRRRTCSRSACPVLLAALPLAQLLRAVGRRRGRWRAGRSWRCRSPARHGTSCSSPARPRSPRSCSARLWPYALLLGGVLGTLILAQYLLQRHFVGPAIALAGRVQEQSDGVAATPPPRVPAPLAPLVRRRRRGLPLQPPAPRPKRATRKRASPRSSRRHSTASSPPTRTGRVLELNARRRGYLRLTTAPRRSGARSAT